MYKNFNYKDYRKKLLGNLKRLRASKKSKANLFLKKGQETIEYIIAKIIKIQVFTELKIILKDKQLLDISKIELEKIENLENIANKVKHDSNIFFELSDEIKFNQFLNLKLLGSNNFYHKNLTPYILLNSKEFILKAIDIYPKIIFKVPKNSNLRDDYDIIDKLAGKKATYLSEVNFYMFEAVLLKKYPEIKKVYSHIKQFKLGKKVVK